MRNFKQMVYIALLVSLGAQFQFSFYAKGFIITTSVIILPLLLYTYNYVSPIGTILTVAIVSPLVRYVIEVFKGYGYINAFNYVYPDIFFYLAYSLFFYLFYAKTNEFKIKKFIITILLCDFLSNIVEIGFRTKLFGITYSMIIGLLGVAVVRALIVFSMIILMEKYKSIMDKKDHMERYQKLYMLTSFFKSESYYIKKNMEQIESLTKKGYEIHKSVSRSNVGPYIKNKTLEFAKDIHEVKKDYYQIVKGLEILEEDNFENIPMDIGDILNITLSSINRQKISIKTNIYYNEKIKEHYYLTSIIRNIINNSIESFEEIKNPLIKIETNKTDDNCIISISDNGSGIKKEYITDIFRPGFSTKYNKRTGVLNRGLGLSIVKDLIEIHFNGSIKVDTELGKGTTIFLVIPIKNLRGEQ